MALMEAAAFAAVEAAQRKPGEGGSHYRLNNQK